uniref:Uncharacterized protein n=1 Tax=Anguilla anguilla TaxID=7936 RepID=A0A0E9TL35_ANGAN
MWDGRPYSPCRVCRTHSGGRGKRCG